ncbi:type II secretion system protein [Candidatus Saccharibacteria bacterium]|nr:type II secretion system protein [Candidatus Saccharibacteria bacterium]
MLKKNNIKSKQGFTIIEVVLVLAIAGLIFLMVFIALPALQRGQRDTQRRNDMSRFLSQLAQYQANNNSNVPGSKDAFNTFIANYLRVNGDTFADPSGTNYTVNNYTACTSTACAQKSAANDYQSGYINVYTNATCNGEAPKYEKGARKIAITYKLEGAGIYCGHN